MTSSCTHQHDNQSLYKAIERLRAYLQSSQFKTILLSTVVFWLVANVFFATNTMFSHDALTIYIDETKTSYFIARGRFSEPLYWWLRGSLNVPWLCGILSLLWITLSNCLVQSFLELRSRTSIILLCGILTVNVSTTLLNATYLAWSDVYSFAWLTALISLWLCKRFGWVGIVPGAILLCFSLGLYQAYLSCVLALIVLLCIKWVFDKVPFKEIAKRFSKMFLCVVSGLILYKIVSDICMVICGVDAYSGYNGIASVGDYSGISIPQLLAQTWIYPFTILVKPAGTSYPKLVAFANVALVSISLFMLFWIAYKQKLGRASVVLLIIVIALSPFAMNAIYFISKGMIHELMIQGIQFFFVFAIYMWDLWCAKSSRSTKNGAIIIKAMPLVLLGAIIFNNVVFANQVYLKKALEYDATASLVTRVVDRIEQTDGYVPGETAVAFVGRFDSSPLLKSRDGFENLTGVGLWSNSAITYADGSADGGTVYYYFKSILGYPINLLSQKDTIALAATKEVKDMPAFPQSDSIKMVGNILVVKIA